MDEKRNETALPGAEWIRVGLDARRNDELRNGRAKNGSEPESKRADLRQRRKALTGVGGE